MDTVLELEDFQTEDIMSLNHSLVSYNLTKSLSKYDKEYRILPELELELQSGRAKPDICIYNKMKVNWLNDVIRLTTPPLVAIEILSPRQALSDLTDKTIAIYFPAGVQSVWIVIPTLQFVQILTNTNETATFSEGTIKDPIFGFEVEFSDLFGN